MSKDIDEHIKKLEGDLTKYKCEIEDLSDSLSGLELQKPSYKNINNSISGNLRKKQTCIKF